MRILGDLLGEVGVLLCECRMSPLGLIPWAERAGRRRHQIQDEDHSGDDWFLVFYDPIPCCS